MIPEDQLFALKKCLPTCYSHFQETTTLQEPGVGEICCTEWEDPHIYRSRLGQAYLAICCSL
ncbi:hypothetical protein IC582_001841 [Cucumis melo]